MKQLSDLIRTNAGFVLLTVNAVLLVVVFFVNDPLDLIKTGYEGASPLIDISQDKISKITINDPDNHGASVTLMRKEPLAPAASSSSDAPAIKEYKWEITISENQKSSVFSADRDRIRQLFDSVMNARRYYPIPRTPEKDRELELSNASNGRFEGLSVEFESADGEKHTIYTGKTVVRGNESYIRLDGENKVFMVQSNIRSAAGSGEADYFRNRRIFGDDFAKEGVTRIAAIFPDAKRTVQISKSGSNWQMFTPVQAQAKETEISSMLSDIENWKASSFPKIIPDKLDKKASFMLEITYTAKGTVADIKRVRFEFLGQKEFNIYVVRDEAGGLMEISSMYIDNLLDPTEKLIGGDEPEGLPQ